MVNIPALSQFLSLDIIHHSFGTAQVTFVSQSASHLEDSYFGHRFRCPNKAYIFFGGRICPFGRGPGLLQNHSGNDNANTAIYIRMRNSSLATLLLFMAIAATFASPASAARTDDLNAQPDLPDSPQPQIQPQATTPAPTPCLVKRASVGLAFAASQAAPSGTGYRSASGAATAIADPATNSASDSEAKLDAKLVPCSASGSLITQLPLLKNLPIVNWYARFLYGPQVKRMTPKQKAWLAVRNVADPFNTLTILASSAIEVGTDAHSPYGPGMTGFGRYVGVSYAQDMTGEFIGTFLIPSIAHQDPHYHRMPAATIKRRIAHCLYQVVWTQGDDGNGMINYADVVGFAIDDEIANLYVPGRDTNLPASAERYGTGLALAPVDNFITEFLPDVARRIHVRVVLIQQIINQVAKTDAVSTP